MSEASAASAASAAPAERRRVVAPRPAASNPSKAWIFVVNNPLDHNIDPNDPRKWFEQSGALSYVCWAYERGAQGTPHIQGYLRLKKGQRRSWLATRICPFAHWEIAIGDFDKNRNYVYKVDRPQDFINEPQELGVTPKPGKRNDMVEAMRLVREGANDRAIYETLPNVAMRYMSSVRDYRLVCAPKRNWKTFVHVLWGPTNVGKSARAHILYPDAYSLALGNTGIWFDGYDGKSDILIDEFRGGIPFGLLLRMTDRYPLTVSVKGAMMNFAPARIVITANAHPSEWYDYAKLRHGHGEDPEQLLRRIELLEHIETTSPAIRDGVLRTLQRKMLDEPKETYQHYSGHRHQADAHHYAPMPIFDREVVDLTEDLPQAQVPSSPEVIEYVPATPEPNPPLDDDDFVVYDSDMDEAHIWPDSDISADDVSDSSVGSDED